MIDQDRLAGLMDDVVRRHHRYIIEGQMGPQWWPEPEEGAIYRKYTMPDAPSGANMALAIPLTPEEQELDWIAFQALIREKLSKLGPRPSKADSYVAS